MTLGQSAELYSRRKLTSDEFGPHFIVTQALQMTLTVKEVAMAQI